MSAMLYGKRIVVVLPAYNAARTLEKTVAEIPKGIVDKQDRVDDGSQDQTAEIARRLGLQVFLHEKNFGYGRNQKTCYTEALRLNADVVVMLHQIGRASCRERVYIWDGAVAWRGRR